MRFYHSKKSKSHYTEARDYYENHSNIDSMTNWLREQFPQVSPYDHVRIIVSPLTRGWQHQDVVKDGKCREIILNVNFNPRTQATKSAKGKDFERGYILFTELNHGSIDPMTTRHGAAMDAALGSRMAEFIGDAETSEYNSPRLALLEYLNWGLIPLYACDTLSRDECETFVKRTADEMNARGIFLRYPEFQAFLIDLYRNRQAGTTIADLMPKIIGWFANVPPAPRAKT